MKRPARNVLGRGLTTLARAGFRRPDVALAIAALLCALAWTGVSRLRLDTDLARLLPEDFASVRALSALEGRAGAIGYVVVVIDGGTAEARRTYARQLAPAIEALPGIRYVDVERPVDWFVDRALYFVDRGDLETAADRIEARAAFEKRRRNPLYLDFEDAAPPSVDMSDLRARYATDGGTAWLTRQATPYYESDDLLALFARPARRATETGFAAEVTAAVAAVVEAQPAEAPGLRARLTGRYQKQVDQKRRIQGDLGDASLLAACLSLLYLLAHFRRVGDVARVLTPLLVGLWWTFGLTGALFGALNILTGFIGAILLGLGVDHGIHLLGAWTAERSAGRSPEAALEHTFGRTGRAVVVAAGTTIAAFAGLALSGFRAFHEFGVVAAVGTACIVLAYALLLPALLAIRPAATQRTPRPISTTLARTLRRPRRTLLLAGGLALIATLPAAQARFDYDFAALEDSRLPSFRLDAAVNRLLGYSQTPTLVLTADAHESRAVAEALRAQAARPETTIDMVVTEADLVPVDQAAKVDVIRRLGRIVRRIEPGWLDTDDQREARAALLKATQTEPFTAAELPPAVRRQFETRDGGGFVLVFPAVSLSDGPAVARFAAEVRAVVDPTHAAGEAMVLADILGMVQREGPTLLALTVGAVLLMLWLALGRLSIALAALGCAGATLAVTVGLAAAAGQPFNYINIIIVPVIVGIAVDGAVHLLDRATVDPPTLTDIGRAVSGSLLTTGFGFGALLVADHPGLDSLGRLALIGLAANALITLVLLPPLAALLHTPPEEDAPCAAPA